MKSSEIEIDYTIIDFETMTCTHSSTNMRNRFPGISLKVFRVSENAWFFGSESLNAKKMLFFFTLQEKIEEAYQKWLVTKLTEQYLLGANNETK